MYPTGHGFRLSARSQETRQHVRQLADTAAAVPEGQEQSRYFPRLRIGRLRPDPPDTALTPAPG